jgi:hypothetical protein
MCIEDGRGGPDPSECTVAGQHEQLARTLRDVGVRVLLVGHQQVGLLDHGRAEMAVQVEQYRNADAVTVPLAQPGDEVSLAVVAAFCHHRAVQVEQQHIQRTCARTRLDDAIAQVLVHLPQGGPSGLGRGRHALAEGGTGLHGQLSPQGMDGPQRCLRLEGRPLLHQLSLLESAPSGRQRREGVGLRGEGRHVHLHVGTAAISVRV